MATGIDPPGPLVGVVNILNEAELRRKKNKRGNKWEVKVEGKWRGETAEGSRVGLISREVR